MCVPNLHAGDTPGFSESVIRSSLPQNHHVENTYSLVPSRPEAGGAQNPEFTGNPENKKHLLFGLGALSKSLAPSLESPLGPFLKRAGLGLFTNVY